MTLTMYLDPIGPLKVAVERNKMNDQLQMRRTIQNENVRQRGINMRSWRGVLE